MANKQYKNPALLTKETWSVAPKDDHTDSFSGLAPYTRVHILNRSEYEIEVRINGSDSDKALIHGGGYATYEAEDAGELFEYVMVINTSASTIAVNLIEVNLGVSRPYKWEQVR